MRVYGRPPAGWYRAGMGDPNQGMQGDLEETVRRARDEMHSVTESLRALLRDLRDEDEPPPTGVRSPGSAPNR
jgi:hypothetical protein